MWQVFIFGWIEDIDGYDRCYEDMQWSHYELTRVAGIGGVRFGGGSFGGMRASFLGIGSGSGDNRTDGAGRSAWRTSFSGCLCRPGKEKAGCEDVGSTSEGLCGTGGSDFDTAGGGSGLSISHWARVCPHLLTGGFKGVGGRVFSTDLFPNSLCGTLFLVLDKILRKSIWATGSERISCSWFLNTYIIKSVGRKDNICTS